MNRVVIILLLLLAGCARQDSAFVVKVIDGDTFVIDSGEHVRLIGVDTPERYEPGYYEAKDYLTYLIVNKTIILEKDTSNHDKYYRLLRYAYINNIFVNEELIKEGLAEPFDYGPDMKHRERFNNAYSEP